MSTGATILLAVLGGIWAQLTRLSDKVGSLEAAQARLTEANTALAHAQTGLTAAHSRIVDDNEELDDAIQQLQLATQRLQDRMAAHERWRMMTNPAGMPT